MWKERQHRSLQFRLMGGGWHSKNHLRGAAIPRTSTWSTSSNHLSSTICACKNDYVNVTLGDEKDIHAEAAMHQAWEGSMIPGALENRNSGQQWLTSRALYKRSTPSCGLWLQWKDLDIHQLTKTLQASSTDLGYQHGRTYHL